MQNDIIDPEQFEINYHYYKGLIAKGGTPATFCDYSGVRSQNVRMRVIEEYLHQYCEESKTFSLIDVGCGMGALRDYIKNLPIKYIGLDILADVYREELLKLNPQTDTSWLFKADLFTLNPSDWKADFVVANGTFVLDWKTRSEDMPYLIDKLWRMCNIGLIVFMLSEFAPPTLRASIDKPLNDPIFWMRWASEHAPRYFVLHDFCPHDFALGMLKKDFSG